MKAGESTAAVSDAYAAARIFPCGSQINRSIMQLLVWLALMVSLIGAAQAQTVEYIHTDALGSPVVITDANRTVLERSEYEPFGGVLAPAVPKDGPGYTGHVFDSATGLNYMQQRYYDPDIGRFLSVDPMAADGATGGNFNRYWYANNNPYKFTDPDGRQTCLGGFCGGGTASDQVMSADQARMQAVREAGNVGELLNGIKPGDPRERIPSRTGTAAYRVVDKSDSKSILESKNVRRLDRITNQMRDFVAEKKASLRELIYSVREDTIIGKAVETYLREAGVRIIKNLPTLQNQPAFRPAVRVVPEYAPVVEPPPMVRPVITRPLIIP